MWSAREREGENCCVYRNMLCGCFIKMSFLCKFCPGCIHYLHQAWHMVNLGGLKKNDLVRDWFNYLMVTYKARARLQQGKKREIKPTQKLWDLPSAHWAFQKWTTGLPNAHKKTHINTSFLLLAGDAENYIHMGKKKTPRLFRLDLALASSRDGWPSLVTRGLGAPLINTLWLDSDISSVPGRLVSGRTTGDGSGGRRKHASRRGEQEGWKKQASTQARRCIFMHPCLKCQEFLTHCDCSADTSPRFNRNRIH